MCNKIQFLASFTLASYATIACAFTYTVSSTIKISQHTFLDFCLSVVKFIIWLSVSFCFDWFDWSWLTQVSDMVVRCVWFLLTSVMVSQCMLTYRLKYLTLMSLCSVSSMCVCVCVSVCVCVCVCDLECFVRYSDVCLFVCLFVCMLVCLFVCLFVYFILMLLLFSQQCWDEFTVSWLLQ